MGALTRFHLIKLGHDESGWITLFRDPDDDRLWELDYPHGGWHGGGPPRLRVVSPEEARGYASHPAKRSAFESPP